MALTAGMAEELMEKIEKNQTWSPDNIQACHQSEEAPEELYALSNKMDVPLNWLDERAKYKEDQRAIEAAYIDGTLAKNSIPPQARQRWNQPQFNRQGKYQGNDYYNSSNTKLPPLRELVVEQGRINDNLLKKVAATDEILEKINTKMDTFSSAIKE